MSLFIAPKTLLVSLNSINGTLERIERHLSDLLDLEREAYRTQRNNLHEDEAYRQGWLDIQTQWRQEDRKHLDAWIATQRAWRLENIARADAEQAKTWEEYQQAMHHVTDALVSQVAPTLSALSTSTTEETPTAPVPTLTAKRRPRKAIAQQEVTPEQSEAINEMARLGQEMEMSE